MNTFIPKEKLSKKEQRKLNLKKRKTWNELNPVTRKPQNPKAYKRKKLQKRDFLDFEASFFYMLFFLLSSSIDIFRARRVFTESAVSWARQTMQPYFRKAKRITIPTAWSGR